MNIRLLAKLLGILAALIGGFMIFSLPWAMPGLGHRSNEWQASHFERDGFQALLASIVVCWAVAALLYGWGRRADGKLYRKEAMAVVGLSWILATVLGALPYYFEGTGRGPAIRVFSADQPALIVSHGSQWLSTWQTAPQMTPDEHSVLAAIAGSEFGSRGLSASQLVIDSGVANAESVFARLRQNPHWSHGLLAPGDDSRAPSDRASNYRIRRVSMTLCDALFESQSGFSTTGASVMAELEDTEEVPHCIHFWRSSTHFLGGLGIIVLFVVLLGHGSAGKALMRTEVPGPAAEGPAARMQHSAWAFAGIYVGLNVVLTLLLLILGMSLFDALCHAFGTMATGGFSTYNASLGHFASPAIEYSVIVFMILAGTNFTLLYLTLLRQPGRLLADIEWRTYLGVIAIATVLIFAYGMYGAGQPRGGLESDFRNALFQITSIITTTGYGTNDFDSWNQFGRALILLLMFFGGCAGSTGGGMKVIRHVMTAKILWIEVEKVFRPRVVRPLRVGGNTEVSEAELKNGILVYLGAIVTLFVVAWLVVVAIEPDRTWGPDASNKLIDSASSVAATLNNIGPGLGIVGPTRNYGDFCGMTKFLFVWLMMLGRLEVWPIIVLFSPRFWQDQ